MNAVNRILGENAPPPDIDLQLAVDWAKSRKERWREAEPYILKDELWSIVYARDVIGGRWPELERTIIHKPYWAYIYMTQVMKHDWPEAERYISKDPNMAVHYAIYVKRRLKDEKEVAKSEYSQKYLEMFPEAENDWLTMGWSSWV